MTGFDVNWKEYNESEDEQKVVMTVHFRPDKKPKNKAEWYKWLGNYALTISKIDKEAKP